MIDALTGGDGTGPPRTTVSSSTACTTGSPAARKAAARPRSAPAAADPFPTSTVTRAMASDTRIHLLLPTVPVIVGTNQGPASYGCYRARKEFAGLAEKSLRAHRGSGARVGGHWGGVTRG